jgi:hypothetical protein
VAVASRLQVSNKFSRAREQQVKRSNGKHLHDSLGLPHNADVTDPAEIADIANIANIAGIADSADVDKFPRTREQQVKRSNGKHLHDGLGLPHNADVTDPADIAYIANIANIAGIADSAEVDKFPRTREHRMKRSNGKHLQDSLGLAIYCGHHRPRIHRRYRGYRERRRHRRLRRCGLQWTYFATGVLSYVTTRL